MCITWRVRPVHKLRGVDDDDCGRWEAGDQCTSRTHYLRGPHKSPPQARGINEPTTRYQIAADIYQYYSAGATHTNIIYYDKILINHTIILWHKVSKKKNVSILQLIVLSTLPALGPKFRAIALLTAFLRFITRCKFNKDLNLTLNYL